MLNSSNNKLNLSKLSNIDNSDLISTNNIEISTHDWNVKLERSIQSLGELSLGYKWMHCEMAKDYTIVYNRLMYTSIALGPFVGVINTANQTFAETTYIPFLITIFSFLTGVLAGIIKFCDYEEKINNHKTAAAHYTSLANNARIQLNLERMDREDPKQYMVWYTTNYGNLFESSPMLPDYVMLKWKTHAKKHGFKIPGEVGILMDLDDSETIKIELEELKKELSEKNTQIESLEKENNNSVDVVRNNPKKLLSKEENKRIRLSMYELGSEHHTDFNANDLARFNNVLMKKEINLYESQTSSRQSSQPNTMRSNRIDNVHEVDDVNELHDESYV